MFRQQFLNQFAIIYALAFQFTICSAQDQSERAIAVQYIEVPALEKGKILLEAARRMEENYSRIKTWSGKLQIEDRQRHNSIESYKNLLVDHVAPPVLRRDKIEVEFDLDIPSNRIAVDYRSLSPIFSEISSGKEFSLRTFDPGNIQPNATSIAQPGVDARGFFQQSIVQSDDYLNFEPYLTYGEFVGVPQMEIVGRVAFRDPAEKASGQGWGIIPDPRKFFGTPVSYFEEMRQLSRVFIEPISSSFSESQKKQALDSIRVSRAEGSDSNLLKVTVTSLDGKTEIVRICDENFNFNPVLAWSGIPNENGVPGARTTYYYKNSDGITIPERVVRITSSSKTEIDFQRVVALVGSQLNKDIPDDNFSCKRFNLKEGERLIDRIDGTVKQIRAGQLVDITNFKPTPPLNK